MAETLIQWTQSPPLPHDVTLSRAMRVPGLGDGKALPKGHTLPAGSRVGGYTFNGWIGCTKVSAGCKFCYAEVSQTAKMRQGGSVLWGPGEDRARTAASTWRKPLTWNRTAETLGVPLFVFAQSLSDTFEDRDDLEGWRLELFELIRQTPHLRWLLLTKRPEVMARFAAEHGWPENAWAGTSVEDQQAADERIPHLLKVPAPVRFLSLEPLLGPVDLELVHASEEDDLNDYGMPGHFQPLQGNFAAALGDAEEDRRWSHPLEERIHWLIIGGESGPKARPMHPEWARSLIAQGVDAGAAVHFKQWGRFVEVDSAARAADGDHVDRDPDNPQDASRFVDGVSIGISPAGSVVRSLVDMAEGVPYRHMQEVGKKAAGRIIDGRTWDEIPGVPRG